MPERVAALAEEVSKITRDRVEEIQEVTEQTRLLAINALIEAAHAGEHGRGFSVVAQQVGEVSGEVKQISKALSTELAGRIADLNALGQTLVRQVRGSRLADLSLNMIDIVDRNLYERSCDVRWWATDSAVVDACADPTGASTQHAAGRLGVILDSYTVYLDLWVADANGRIIANGRQNRFPAVIGSDVRHEPWYRHAMSTSSGADFAVEDIRVCPQLDRHLVATYSTAIRAGGLERGAPIGALGIFFDWQAQAGGVLAGVRLDAGERARTRCLLVDASRRVIAASDGVGVLDEVYPLRTESGPIGFYQTDRATVGYAMTPGYETYRGLGWYGVIEQRSES